MQIGFSGFSELSYSQYKNKINSEPKKSQKPAFSGVHEEAAEAVLNFTAHRFKSPSLLTLLAYKRKGQQKSEQFLRLETIKSENILFYDLRPKMHRQLKEAEAKNYSGISFDQYINIIKSSIETQRKLNGKVYVNCGELAALTQYELLKRGIEAHQLLIKLLKKTMTPNKIPCPSHCAVITGLDKNAIIETPSTWGDNAKVIDLWTKHDVVMPARDWLKRILKFIRFNPDEADISIGFNNSKPAVNAIYTLQQKQNLDKLFAH